MRVRTIAPAKVNWTLEVLGKRPDGYHEVRSVMQTVDLCDEVEVRKKNEGRRKKAASGSVIEAGAATLVVEGEHEAREDDLTLRAVRVLEEMRGLELPVEIRLLKRIPVGAGLGGGSSDAAAVLRAARALPRMGLSDDRLAAAAAGVGSDAPFFISGGRALVEGRGERVTPLPDVSEAWLVILAPPIWMEEKTKRMYGALTPADFGDGGRTEALVERLRRGERVRAEDLCNAFERATYESFAGLAGYRERLLGAGAGSVHLAGAGPALFAVLESREEADGVAGRIEGTDARVFVARTLGAGEATRVEG